MKKLMMSAVMVVFAIAAQAQAQGDAISKFFNKYNDDESFSQVNISSKMFSLFTNMEVEKPEDKEVLKAISKLKGLRILGKENTSDARALYKEAFALIPKTEFEELMSVRDKDRDMKFLIKEKDGKIAKLVMVMGSMKDFMVLSLFGEIDLKQVSQIGSKMDISGLDQLKNMDKKNDKSTPAPKEQKKPTSKDNE